MANRAKDPWARNEPGNRLSQKQKINQGKSVMELMEMKGRASMNVNVVFPKKLWYLNYYKGVSLEFSYPLGKREIMKRMSLAFPELTCKFEGDEE